VRLVSYSGRDERGHLPVDDALDRMHPDHYGFAASEFGVAGATTIALRVDAALRKALGYESSLALPEIETSTPDAESPGAAAGVSQRSSAARS
jgi:hypothetical protein